MSTSPPSSHSLRTLVCGCVQAPGLGGSVLFSEEVVSDSLVLKGSDGVPGLRGSQLVPAGTSAAADALSDRQPPTCSRVHRPQCTEDGN